MRISDWISDVCSSDLGKGSCVRRLLANDMQDQAGDQRLGFLVPMRLARFAGGVIDQCVGQRHAVVGEIEAGRVDTIQWIERGPDHARYAEGIEDMDRAEACAITRKSAGKGKSV